MGVYDTRGNYSPTPGVCRPAGPVKSPPKPPPPEYTWENQPPRTLYAQEPTVSCLVGVRFLWSNGECLVGCPWALTQEDGQVIRGTLDSKSFLSQVTEGLAHRIRLNPRFDPKAQLGGIRSELQKVLHEILAAERVEADRLTAIQAQRSAVANVFYAQIALGRGFLYGAWGLVESSLEFADLANPFDELAQAAVAAWKAEPEPGKGWLDSFLEQYTAAQYRDLAAALGFDPATISREKMAQAYEAANYIFEDAASKRVLRDFAAEYVSIQNHESILEFTGGMVFEIVLAALLVFLTGGTGLAARASVASTRLTPLLTRLGETLGKLGANLKKARVYEAGIAEGKGSGSQTVVIPQAKAVVPQPVAAPPRKSRNKPPPPDPNAEGRPHTILEKPGRFGQYTTYEADGTWKQYRGSGKEHGHIQRPNVKAGGKNINKETGEVFIDKGRVRLPRPDEYPGSRL
ncbi:polymorphic toxin type 24 domain-containing protein [Pseudomonas alliivorans]|nr:polymorphic toxin type 24 domain-containing protein [Pseudomonas alliivorans]MEE4723237.1 polymorphic toxin type 24 domain-containing protein [Pseudomonas alliivorans]MEE4759295.1 polymorphic toxin type 24 domain-containing protein [Pseudomonas alliivorans]MEE4763841.1 polymorphic toxin type 24 domain-containing protein [Pseudomonas alliivorans]MEE4774688.1 polymorphic toxin type 24 domain-containing protein [Pseudomonas alliivorans]